MSFINKMNIGNVSYDIQAGEKVQLTFPAGATNGTLTDEQLATLQANYQSCIEMVNDKEIYTLNDNGHTDGYLTYSHVGIENGKATIKTLTITISAKSFVIVKTVVESGTKYYMHIVEGPDKDDGSKSYSVPLISPNPDKITGNYLLLNPEVGRGSIVTKYDYGSPSYFGVFSGATEGATGTVAITCYGSITTTPMILVTSIVDEVTEL